MKLINRIMMLLVVFLLITLESKSQNDSLVIYLKNGTKKGISLSNIKSSGFVTYNQVINLKQGWNMISSYLIPPAPDSMQYVCETINDRLVIAKNGAGKTYIPSFNINNIGSWNVLNGYQVYLSGFDTLKLSGNEVVPENIPIYLNSSWSLISYLRNTPLDVALAFASIIDDNRLIIAKNGAGQTYIPSFGINNIGTLKPGEGYQVYMSAKDTLIYPANTMGKKVFTEIGNSEPKYLKNDYSNTGNNSTLLLEINLEDNSELAVYNSNQKIVGSGVVKNGVCALTIWGDNSATDDIDGANETDELFIKNYSINTGKISDVEIISISDFITNLPIANLNYKQNKFIRAKANVQDLNSNFSLNIKPNPAIDNIDIEISTPDCLKTEISIYSSGGKLIDNLNIENNSLIKYNVSNLQSGEYSIIMTCGTQKAMRKVIVVR